ncbi:MAG: gliding motility-associated C-terminal domain-containing protein [Sphingobacteriaceae bacterium]|nr:gliding motility-associated C-terminal domain-containing protein [Sphingobacteriaceae bacterium]
MINKITNKILGLQEPKAMLLALCLIISSFNGQVNYVPNPSFETIINLDTTLYFDVIYKAVPWDTLKAGGGGGSIIGPPSPSMIPVMGFQTARTGNFMAGINYYNSTSFLKWRSYIQAPLTKSLVSNKSYCVTFYVNLFNSSKYASDELSAYLDDGTIAAIAFGEVAVVNPQIKSPVGIFLSDTLNWMKVQETFIASGNESYITLGNFKPQALLTASLVYPGAFKVVADYHVDDVSVIETDLAAYAGKDTIICIGDSVFIGRPPEIGLECLWSTSANSTTIGNGGGLWVKPATTQTYIVTQDVCGLIKKDTVQVQVKPKYNGLEPILSSNSPTTCPNNTITLNILNNPPGTNTYSWLPLEIYTQTNNFSAQAQLNANTIFTLNINNNGEYTFCPFQKTASLSISVPIYTNSPTLISNLNPVCPNDTIIFSYLNSVPGNSVSSDWFPKSSFTYTSNLIAKTLTHINTNYSVNISSTGNASICAFSRSLSISISVADTCFKELVIPNIFTPNNDNSNDQWLIKFPYGYSLQNLSIFDRWGTLIYHRENLNFNKQGYALIGWDGRNTSGEEISAGVYFYVLQYTGRAGVQKIIKGNITLMQ